jgi:hypothetical protein
LCCLKRCDNSAEEWQSRESTSAFCASEGIQKVLTER